MKLTKKLKVVEDGDIHPSVYEAGTECPKQHLELAKKLGVLEKETFDDAYAEYDTSELLAITKYLELGTKVNMKRETLVEALAQYELDQAEQDDSELLQEPKQEPQNDKKQDKQGD